MVAARGVGGQFFGTQAREIGRVNGVHLGAAMSGKPGVIQEIDNESKKL